MRVLETEPRWRLLWTVWEDLPCIGWDRGLLWLRDTLTVLEYCNEKYSLKMETHNNITISISQQTDTTMHNMCFPSSIAHLSISIFRLLPKAQKSIYPYICVPYIHTGDTSFESGSTFCSQCRQLPDCSLLPSAPPGTFSPAMPLSEGDWWEAISVLLPRRQHPALLHWCTMWRLLSEGWVSLQAIKWSVHALEVVPGRLQPQQWTRLKPVTVVWLSEDWSSQPVWGWERRKGRKRCVL